MKRFLRNLTAVIALAMLLSACADKPGFSVSDPSAETDTEKQYDLDSGTAEDDFTPVEADPYDYMANDLTPYIKVADYHGLKVTEESAELTDEEFENELDTLLESYAYYEEFTDRKVEEGDTVIADYAGYLDGVQFSGGTATDQRIKAASGTGYIEGFAEAFIGQMPGTEFDFEVTFPEVYDNADLAGQKVTFICTVKSIVSEEQIVPELTDEFVNTNFGYNNVEEFKIAYRPTVEEQKKYYVENNMYSDLWKQIVDASEVIDYPGVEVDRVYSERRVLFEEYANYYGMDYETFLKSYKGISDDELYTESQNYVKEDLVMYSLIKELDVNPTDEEYDEGIQFFADYYGMSAEELKSYYGEDAIKTSIRWQKMMERLAEYAEITQG